LGLALISQIFPLDMTVADRWFYFPIVGLLGMLGVLINRLNKSNILLASLVLILLSTRTIIRIGNYKNALTLYQHDAPLYENYDLENYLGYELAAVNQKQAALVHFITAAQLLPHDTNLYNIGSIYEQTGDYDQAISYYRQALNVKDKYLNHQEVRLLAYTGLTRLLVLHANPSQSLPVLLSAVQEFPQNGTFWSFLAITHYKLSNQPSALEAAAKAKQFLPNESTAKLYLLILNHKEIILK